MAFSGSNAGYECEFVTPLTEYLQTECSVCLLVLRSPHITSCCGHNFCKVCIEGIQKDGKSCPLCNAREFSLTYNRTHDVTIKQLVVYCTLRKIGCEWQGKLEVRDKHIEDCPFREVECEFKYAGCGTKRPRKDMSEHLKENLCGHMSLLARQNQELLQEVKRLRCQVQVGTAHPTAPIQIIMASFEQHKKDKDEWYSEGFYTHPQGYKICLKVYANGFGNNKDTHVSCFIYLMRGEFDDWVKWPFQGVITIQLLNQREDIHHTMTLSFNYQTPVHYTAQVTSGERAVGGWGITNYIPHSELGHNAATNCQYLMNDCLFFRVKVELK